MKCVHTFLVYLLLLYNRRVSCTCTWSQNSSSILCDIRDLNLNHFLEDDLASKLSVVQSLSIQCSDQLYYQSRLRSDHFGSLPKLRSLKILYCKLNSLPPRSFVGLPNLEDIKIQSVNTFSNTSELAVDYEAFVGLNNLKHIDLSRSNIRAVSSNLLCSLRKNLTVNLSHNKISNIEDVGLSRKADASSDCASVTRVVSLDISANEIRTITESSLENARSLVKLIARENRLEALDSRAFKGLVDLEYVDISNNKLTVFPSGLFAHTPNINHLDFSSNSIGTIHKDIFRNVSGIRYINFSRNHLDQNWLKGLFDGMEDLETLDLSFNQISSIDKDVFRSLKSLRWMSLSNNRIVEMDSACLTWMTSLTSLHLESNKLESVPGSIFSTSALLEHLDLSHNQIQSLDKQTFARTTALRRLRISSNLLTEVPRGLANLTLLDFSGNILGILRNSDLEPMKQLRQLFLNGNEISRIEPASLDSVPSVEQLDLSRNRIKQIDQATFGKLANLKQLSLSVNELKDINGLLANQTGLRYLNISSNLIQWFDYAFIPNSLETIDLQNNQIEEVENYYSLKEGFNLKYLNVANNKIKKLGVLSLLPSLENIILRKNEISDIGHNTFFSKKNLSFVDLRENKLTVLGQASLIVSERSQGKPEFLLSGNPFHCSCDVQWMTTSYNVNRLPTLADLPAMECLEIYSRGRSTRRRMVELAPEQFLCEYSSHCFSLCMCCDFFGCDCRMQCPDGCSCFHDTAWSANLVQCSAREHRKIPPLIPMDATSVLLDGNIFHNLSEQLFLGRSRMKKLNLNNSQVFSISNSTFFGLHDLQVLDLSTNFLKELTGSEFGHLVNLKELYLQSNRLRSIATDTFRELKSLSTLNLNNNLLVTFPIWELSSNPFLSRLSISNNMWSCECEFVKKFRMFIDGNLKQIENANEVKCLLNENLDKQLLLTSKTCNDMTKTGMEIESNDLLTIIVCCVLLFCTVLIGVILCRSKNWITKKSLKSSIGVEASEKPQLDPRFVQSSEKINCDVFVLYSPEDGLVAQEIRRKLPNYKVCLQHQEDNGRTYTRSFDRIRPRSALVILSRAFLSSELKTLKDTWLDTVMTENIPLNLVVMEEVLPDLTFNADLKKVSCYAWNVLSWKEDNFWELFTAVMQSTIARTEKNLYGQYLQVDRLAGSRPEARSTLSLNHSKAETPGSRQRAKSRFSTIESNNEFIYLTPKPKKARCQPGNHAELLTGPEHARSSSEICQQEKPVISHQRSRSNPYTKNLEHRSSQRENFLVDTPSPMLHQADNYDNPGKVYGSTSFIYKLISSSQVAPAGPPPENRFYAPAEHQRSSYGHLYPRVDTLPASVSHQKSKSAVFLRNQALGHGSGTLGHQRFKSTDNDLPPPNGDFPVNRLAGGSPMGRVPNHPSNLSNGWIAGDPLNGRITGDLSHGRIAGEPPNEESPKHRTTLISPVQRRFPSQFLEPDRTSNNSIHQRSKSSPHQGFIV